jgi:hypothetical protein
MNFLANIGSVSNVIGPEHLVMTAVTAVALAYWIPGLAPIKFLWALPGAIVVNILVFAWLSEADTFWLQRLGPQGDPQSQYVNVTSILLCAYIAVNLGLALILKVYSALVLQKSTEPERATGLPGVRAWLAPRNAITVVLFSIAATMAFDWNFFGVFLLGLSPLLIYPLVGSVARPTDFASPPAQAAPEERQRVLALVETGKITAEDGAELLGALAQSQAAGVESARIITRPRRLMILGAIILLIGFFLPWFTENVSQAMSQMAGDLQHAMPQLPGQFAPGLNPNQPIQVPTAPQDQMLSVLTLRGGDVRNGLGWLALAMGLLAAILPFFWSERAADPKTLRNFTFAALGLGTVALLYLLSNSFNAITTIEPGFYLSLGGFVLLWVGGAREFVALHPRLQATLTTA